MTSSTTDLDVLALATTLEQVVTMVRRLTPSEDLSLTAISTLRSLELSGPTRLTELAGAQGVTQPGMTQLVTRLERDGYATRQASDADARVVLVDVTATGRSLLTRRRELRAHQLTVLLGHIPARDRAAIIAAIPALTLLADLG
jgi:DNA-binding MarR family transcriptional regulator